MNLISIWADSQSEIKKKVGETSYETWISTVLVKEKDANTLIIESPDDFFKNWIIDHYQDLLKEIVCEKAARDVEIVFSVNSQILKTETQNKITKLCSNRSTKKTAI